MTGTNDTVTSGSTRAAANGAVQSVGAAVFVAELAGAGLDASPLDAVVKSVGGLVLTTDSGGDFGGLVDDIGETVETQQYLMLFAASTRWARSPS